ncbi:hypothetical protein C0989_001484 [Termitomyces sp. Mn162]|nr:hypothetical protein C0989_001484 [Termitomyces sp. Mn162]
MLCAIRAAASRSSVRAFSTTSSRAADLAKLTLIGYLARDPETRHTKNEREYVVYTVATKNYPPPPPDANGGEYEETLKKGSRVYVEAGFELREPEPNTDPTTPQGQRQIFLRHETVRVLSKPRVEPEVEE